MVDPKETGRRVGHRVFLAWVVGIVFIIQKLCGAIDWSWWTVTSPFWGSAAYILLALFFVTILGIATEAVNDE